MPVSTLEVAITGDSSRLTAALTQGAASAKSFEGSVGGVANTAKTALSSIGIGAAAAGLAVSAFAKKSFDAATDFDRSFTQIAALTNTSADAIDGLKQHVLDLAGETAQAPTDLANAMYFLASAGLDSGQQMAALEASAKGAAVGLGDAGDLARITANALNVFADNGLQATDVIDTLVAAVREGSAEPDEFADALGRVLPIADKAGISFQQVAASLATMSNAGLDVNEGVTALRGTLQSLVSPTTQTQDALAGIGLTVDDVVASLKQNGLIATLRLLDSAARKNTESTGDYNIVMRELVPNVRALTGVFNLTGQQADKVDEIFRAVADSGGDLSKAFAITADSASFKLKKALNDLSITGQQIASDVLPAVASALKLAADNAKVLFATLAGYAALRFVRGILEGIAVATEHVAAAEALAAGAGLRPDLSLGQRIQQLQRWNAVAADAAIPVNRLASAQASAAGTAARLGNTLEGSSIPQVYALVLALQGAQAEFQGFQARGLTGALDSALHTAVNSPLFKFFTGGAEISGLGPSAEDIQNLEDANTVVTAGFIEAGTTAKQQTKIIQDALAQVDYDPAHHVEDFVAAIQGGIAAAQGQADAEAAAADKADELAAKQQAAVETTQSWQDRVAGLTGKLDGLSVIGVDVTSFLDDFRQKLEDADDPQAAFAQGLADIQQSAADWRAQTSESITGVGDVLGTLAQKSHLTATDVHEAFQQAATDARLFSADLITIANTGGQTGKALADSLLQAGPAMAGLADLIAGSGDTMRDQLVSDFGDILAAGDTGASKLQQVLVPVLKDIRHILTALAKEWGITLHDNAPDSKRHVDDLHGSLQDLPPKTVLSIKTDAPLAQHDVANLNHSILDLPTHTVLDIKTHVHGSDLPDEVLRKHLFDPMKRGGFKKVGDSWTLPLDVAARSSVDPIASPGTGNGAQTSLHRLIQVEVDNRGILRDIRGVLKRLDAVGGAHSSGSAGGTGGPIGSVGPSGKAAASLEDAMHRVLKLTSASGATLGEGVGVIKRVLQQGSDAGFIKKAVGDVRDELGKDTAALYARALRRLDDATLHSDAKRAALIKQALRTERMLEGQQGKPLVDELSPWYEYALSNIPTLPAGHTNIDVNRHNRGLKVDVTVGRERMDQQAAYHESYRGF